MVATEDAERVPLEKSQKERAKLREDRIGGLVDASSAAVHSGVDAVVGEDSVGMHNRNLVENDVASCLPCLRDKKALEYDQILGQ